MQVAKNVTERTTGAVARKTRSRLPEQITSDEIRHALEKSGGSLRGAAKVLGMARNTFTNRLVMIGQRVMMNLPLDTDSDKAISTILSHQPKEYDLSVLTPDTWQVPRGCFQCGEKFTPKRKQDWRSHFCHNDHRKLYHFTPISKKTEV